MSANHLENHAREHLKMPETWHAFRYECFPKGCERTLYFQITGAVCTATYTKGPREGSPNWKKRDRTTECAAIITPEEHDAWLKNWEKTTGLCHECHGTTQEWAGWSVTEGNRYRPCTTCKATGKPTLA